jgi:hypothetical protein
MGRKLRTSVVVNSELHGAGSEPPADVAKQITNEDAWEDVPSKASSSKRSSSASRSEEESEKDV